MGQPPGWPGHPPPAYMPAPAAAHQQPPPQTPASLPEIVDGGRGLDGMASEAIPVGTPSTQQAAGSTVEIEGGRATDPRKRSPSEPKVDVSTVPESNPSAPPE